MSATRSPLAHLWLGVVRGLELFTAALFALLTLVVLWGVVSRYVLGAQSTWTDELARYLLVWVSLLGGAVMYREHGHLGVDYFVGKLDVAAQRGAAIIVELIVLAFAAGALGYGGWALMSEAFRSSELTSSLGIRVGWLHIATPLSGAFIAAFAIEHLVCGRLSYPASPSAEAETGGKQP